MHVKSQHALIVREKVMRSKSRRLRSNEGSLIARNARQSHSPDTDSRLLTEINCG
jgi:hypothetical protein